MTATRSAPRRTRSSTPRKAAPAAGTTVTTVAVRMYNVGFGDAFVVTVRRDDRTWRMIVDCGVHDQGRARPLADSVAAIIDDLKADSGAGTPHVDVVVATHHHADHIAGFALDAWQDVAVDEVWVPFVEDPDDPDAKALRESQTATAQRLLGLVEQRVHGLDAGGWPAALSAARWFAANSSGNARATDRLCGRNGLGFAGPHRVRYLPSTDAAQNLLATSIDGVSVHVLGPPRDPEFLKHMDPPKQAGWLQLDGESQPMVAGGLPLFGPSFRMSADECRDRYPQLLDGHEALRNLDAINDQGLLAAASILERSVNNTSVFLVLDVAGTRLVFPGDAQQGAWDHVLDDPAARELVASAAFYKIGHHGSGNATPKRYVDEVLVDGGYTMLPWGLVKRWADTIPQADLLAALAAHHHPIIRADHPEPEPDKVVVHDDLWSEVTFRAGV